ncbi:hypothetical protein MTO96_019015 [Rhipicephalus appendiculatus]
MKRQPRAETTTARKRTRGQLDEIPISGRPVHMFAACRRRATVANPGPGSEYPSVNALCASQRKAVVRLEECSMVDRKSRCKCEALQ